MKFCFFVVERMDSIKRWGNLTSLKCQLCQIYPTCYQFWLQIRLVHQTSLSKTTKWFARIESCWELTQPCCLKPFELQFLSPTESSREQLHRHLTRVACWWWWHWWHVTASGAEPLLGLSYLPLACWEPPLSLIRPNTARSGHSSKSAQHHISGETTPLCRQIPQTSFRSYLNGWGIVRSGFRNHAKIEQL